MREYVQGFSKQGKSTKVLVAALRFRFEYCEKRGFDYTRLIKESTKKRPHRCLSDRELEGVDSRLKEYPLMRAACSILYDLAARVQDLVQFRFDSFVKVKSGLFKVDWVPDKSDRERSGFIRGCTKKILDEAMLYERREPNDRLFPSLSEHSIKDYFGKFFKGKAKLENVKSHDFRTTKITHLLAKEKVDARVVQEYVGHKDIATTMRYRKVGKDEGLKAIGTMMLGKRGQTV